MILTIRRAIRGEFRSLPPLSHRQRGSGPCSIDARLVREDDFVHYLSGLICENPPFPVRFDCEWGHWTIGSVFNNVHRLVGWITMSL